MDKRRNPKRITRTKEGQLMSKYTSAPRVILVGKRFGSMEGIQKSLVIKTSLVLEKREKNVGA